MDMSSNGIVPGAPIPQQTQPPGEMQGGPGQMGLTFARNLLALHQARQQGALGELNQNITAAQGGFPVDSKHLVKLAKKAGFKIDDSPEGLKAFIGQQQGQPGQGGQPKQGGQQQPQGAQGGQGQKPQQMTREQRGAQVAEMWAQNAIQQAHAKGESAARLAQLSDQVTQLKSAAINGSPDEQKIAAGKLMAINEIPFSIDRATWNAADPQHRQAMVDIAAGHESDADKQKRATTISNELLTTGRYTDPEAATKAGTALASGQGIPADVKAKEVPHTMAELTSQASLASSLVNLGYSPDMVSRVEKGGMSSLPTGVIPLVVQQVAMQKQQLKLEAQRVGLEGFNAQTERGRLALEVQRGQIEEERYKATAAKLDASMKTEQDKAFLQNFQAIMDLKKSGATIPKDLLDGYMAQLGEKSGMDVTEVKKWYQYVTGGSTLQFTPKPASDLARSAAGTTPNAPKGSPQKSEGQGAISKFYKNVKRSVSGETTD